MELIGNGRSVHLGQCIETAPGKFLVYNQEDDKVILGKLDFGWKKPEPILSACRAEIPMASTLGFIYSGSMEALTLATNERGSAVAVADWFKRHYPELFFSIWWY